MRAEEGAAAAALRVKGRAFIHAWLHACVWAGKVRRARLRALAAAVAGSCVSVGWSRALRGRRLAHS